MAVNDPAWSYGKSELVNSSGLTTDPGWSYGLSRLLHLIPPIIGCLTMDISSIAPRVAIDSNAPSIEIDSSAPRVLIEGRCE